MSPADITPRQNLVSSLPFLAPIFIRKAKDYRSKQSSGPGSGYGRSKGRHQDGGEAYKLSDRGNDKSLFVSADHKSATGSEENILQGNSIVTSVTYTVQVDE